MRKKMIEEIGIIGGLIGVQIVYAGSSILQKYLMSLGLDAFTIVIFFNFTTFLLLTPFAIVFERKLWPGSCSLKLIIKLILMSFTGITMFQCLYLEGLRLTSPSVATAMPNLAPAFVFIIAWVIRIEKVKLSCVYSRVRIGGTVLCVIGAFTMSLMHSTVTSTEVHLMSSFLEDMKMEFDKNKIIGCIYLLAAVIFLSVSVVLQASTLAEFPAPITMCGAASFIGVLITEAIQLNQHHKMEPEWPFMNPTHLIALSLLGGGAVGASISFSGWAIRKKGPVVVTLFSPIATLMTLLTSLVTIGEFPNLGSMAGMSLMFAGLYFVMWAKGKENCDDGDGMQTKFDMDKPLLG